MMRPCRRSASAARLLCSGRGGTVGRKLAAAFMGTVITSTSLGLEQPQARSPVCPALFEERDRGNHRQRQQHPPVVFRLGRGAEILEQAGAAEAEKKADRHAEQVDAQ